MRQTEFRIETLTELRKEVERRYGARIPDKAWEMSEPNMADDSPPWGEGTVKSILKELLSNPERQLERQLRESRRKMNRATDALRKQFPFSQFPFSWLMPPWARAEVEKINSSGVPWAGDYVGKPFRASDPLALQKAWRDLGHSLGVTLPIPIMNLRETLLKLGFSEEPKGVPLPYPTEWPSLIPYGMLDFPPLRIATVYAHPDTTLWPDSPRKARRVLKKLKALRMTCTVYEIASKRNLHPAEVVAALYCGKTLWRNSFKVYQEGDLLTMKVYNPRVSIGSLAQAFRFARDTIIRESTGGQPPHRGRAKGLSKKTDCLLGFSESDEWREYTWKQRLASWNESLPDWKYPDVHTMATTYYRARKRAI